MSLKDLNFPEVKVETPGGKVAVRGLSLDDIIRIVRDNREAASNLFDQFKLGAIRLDDTTTIGAAITDQAPDLAAQVIALGAGDGDEESIDIAKRLPFPVQLELLEKIGEQTFVVEGGMEKIAETIVKVIQGMSGLVKSLTPGSSALTNGSGVSGEA